MDDHELATDLASRAGALLLDLRADAATEGLEGKALGAAGDSRADELLLAELRRERPGDPVLSEESKDDRSRLGSPRVWIVDPLDGTREYSEGRSDWAVHVALVEGTTPTAAAVALPGEAMTLSTRPAPPPRAEPPARPRILVSRTRPPGFAAVLCDEIGGELVPMGSAGAKAMAVVRGLADVYAHAGGQYEWDSAAPVGVAAAAGMHVSRVDGSPLTYNAADPYLPDLLVCHPSLAEQVLDVLGRLL
ncbi:MAG: 3'(2'),5'-bisphosphate nucleotidase CysQ [Acidimicrobiia bacterium]|nr:3'(2'),5'-bisphosphate nucleotidase CysQ [Acidimicrobiia bacterium]